MQDIKKIRRNKKETKDLAFKYLSISLQCLNIIHSNTQSQCCCITPIIKTIH